MKTKKFLIALCTILIHNSSTGTNIISFFIRPCPTLTNEKKAIKKINKLTHPGKLADYTLKELSQNYIVSGICCTYGGYMAVSDLNGQVIFPRRHKTADVDLIITKHIIPITMLHNTIHHWEFEEGTLAKMYSIVRKEDKETDAFFWDVNPIKIPKDDVIPIKSIVILADPKYVLVPSGITLTKESNQLILPDIYVKKGIKKIDHILYSLGINVFFQSTESQYKKAQKNYLQHLKE